MMRRWYRIIRDFDETIDENGLLQKLVGPKWTTFIVFMLICPPGWIIEGIIIVTVFVGAFLWSNWETLL